MTKAPVQHRQSVDLARFVAAFGILVAHVFLSKNDWIGHLSLSLFLILTAFLAVQSMQRAGGRYDWARRAPRIFAPWLFWCAVYKLVLIQVTDGAEKFAILTDPWSLIVGPFVHLWFLPFIVLASLCVVPMGQWVTSARAVRVASIALLVLGVMASWLQTWPNAPAPLPQWLYSVVPYFYGVLVALAAQLGGVRWPQVALVVACVAGFKITGDHWMIQPLVAALLFQLVWEVPLRGRILPHLGQVAFGIYLLHPFFLLVCYKLLGADLNLWVGLVMTFGMSWAATICLRATPYLRHMV
jgi:peptidoglycan/LPS O-acetylase OafA/YrhL